MYKTRLIPVIFTLFILAGCGVKVSYPSDFPTQVMLSQEDMPDHWYRSGGDDFEVNDAVAAHLIGFEYKPEKLSRSMSQRLIIYKDGNKAEKSYSDLVTDYFPTDDWRMPDIFIFKPKNKNDQFDFRCIESEPKINGISQGKCLGCISLQQHEQYISLIHVNIDGETLTLDQFKDILAKSDEHLYNDISQGPAVQ